MKKGQLKRIVAGILALLLLVGMVPIVEWIKVEAAPANIREMNLNIDGEIAGIGNPTVPSANTDPWIGSRVYFAQGGGVPRINGECCLKKPQHIVPMGRQKPCFCIWMARLWDHNMPIKCIIG